VYSEKTAPNNATKETIAAAIRKGEGGIFIAITEDTISKIATAKRIRISIRGMALLIVVTELFWGCFLF
jgi:hypothetical protein